MRKTLTYGALVALSLAIAPAALNAAQPTTASAVTATQAVALKDKVAAARAADKEKNVTVDIASQADLDAYLARTGGDLTGDYIQFRNDSKVTWPKDGVYTVHGGSTNFSYFSNSGDVDFNGTTLVIGSGSAYAKFGGDQKGRTISNLNVIGSVQANPDVAKANTNPIDGKWSSGSFINSLLHADNITFENHSYLNALGLDMHLFDIMGSKHVTLDGISARGSALSTDLSQDYLKALWTKNSHGIISEAIQFDVATSSAAGGADLTDGKVKANAPWWGDSYDGVATTDAVLRDSEFTGYTGVTGHGLITGDMTETSKYGAAIGSHSTSPNGEGMTVLLDGILMADTVNLEGIPNNELAPIKFQTSDWKNAGLGPGLKQEAVAKDPIRKTTKITLNDITFRNTRKTGYWNGHGEVTNNSIWTIWYDDIPDATPDEPAKPAETTTPSTSEEPATSTSSTTPAISTATETTSSSTETAASSSSSTETSTSQSSSSSTETSTSQSSSSSTATSTSQSSTANAEPETATSSTSSEVTNPGTVIDSGVEPIEIGTTSSSTKTDASSGAGTATSTSSSIATTSTDDQSSTVTSTSQSSTATSSSSTETGTSSSSSGVSSSSSSTTPSSSSSTATSSSTSTGANATPVSNTGGGAGAEASSTKSSELTVKAAGKKAPVETASRIDRVLVPLVTVLLAASAAVIGFVSSRKRS